jgi:GT2 family glycosyltransferase
MAITAVVVNFNAGDHLGACVQSLLDEGVREVRVVDNASSDGSFERLRGRFGRSPSVEMLANPANRGFGPAVNDQLASLRNEYLLIINPDCRLASGALGALAGALDADPAAGLAGPAVEDEHGRPEPAACRFYPTPRRAFMTASGLSRLAGRFPSLAGIASPQAQQLDRVTEAEATSGACMLLRTDAFRALGGFDEAYQLHCEDLDLMYRLREAGWKILYVPAARAVHAGGVSSASRPLWVHRQKHRGIARFFRTHLASRASWPSRLLFPLGVWLHWMLLWPFQWVRR